MERTIKVFKSSAEAEKADKEYYRSLSPPRRIEIHIMTFLSSINFEEAWPSHEQGELDGLSVPFISRAMLKRNKAASGRLQDLADLEYL